MTRSMDDKDDEEGLMRRIRGIGWAMLLVAMVVTVRPRAEHGGSAIAVAPDITEPLPLNAHVFLLNYNGQDLDFQTIGTCHPRLLSEGDEDEVPLRAGYRFYDYDAGYGNSAVELIAIRQLLPETRYRLVLDSQCKGEGREPTTVVGLRWGDQSAPASWVTSTVRDTQSPRWLRAPQLRDNEYHQSEVVVEAADDGPLVVEIVDYRGGGSIQRMLTAHQDGGFVRGGCSTVALPKVGIGGGPVPKYRVFGFALRDLGGHRVRSDTTLRVPSESSLSVCLIRGDSWQGVELREAESLPTAPVSPNINETDFAELLGLPGTLVLRSVQARDDHRVVTLVTDSPPSSPMRLQRWLIELEPTSGEESLSVTRVGQQHVCRPTLGTGTWTVQACSSLPPTSTRPSGPGSSTAQRSPSTL
jgi:hypothetical protein